MNSKDLAESFQNITIEECELLNSHDVVALFTNTPVDMTLNIIRKKLEQDLDLKNRTLLSVDDIIQLTEFSLCKMAYFSYAGINSVTAWLWVALSAPFVAICIWSG